MSTREELIELPFITRRKGGSLNMWNAATTGNREADLDLGRQYAARLLQFYRTTGATGVAPHIHEVWIRQSPESERDVREGFGAEVLGAFARAPAGATPSLAIAEATLFSASSPLALPFVSRREDGSLDGWDVRPSGDWGEDCATGRHYGALLARFYRLTGDVGIIRLVYAGQASDPDRFEASRGIWVGLVTEMAEIMAASCPRATVHQRAALAYFEGV